MNKTPGVYQNILKNGTVTYRASFTHRSKHISLGTYETESLAGQAYSYAVSLMETDLALEDYPENCPLNFEKFVILCNLRDNGIYISKPVYLEKKYFTYHFSPTVSYKFDMDDLFYFSSHKLMKRGNHLFVSDYGLQISLNERFGIRPFAAEGRDYVFINGDRTDFRRENIEIINRYHGVTREEKKTAVIYKTVVHVNGNIIVGRYDDEIEAAIAYNKAVDILNASGVNKNYPQNYIDGLSAREYADIYTRVKISEKLDHLME